MSDYVDIKDLIRNGRPESCDEARSLVALALPGTPPDAISVVKLRAALMGIVLARQLQGETYKARAAALALLDELDGVSAARLPQPPAAVAANVSATR